MHPKYYLSQEIFDLEREKIFRKVWLFVGLTAMIAEPGSSISRRIAGIPLVLMNDGGKARALGDGAHEYALRQVGSLLLVNFDPDPMPLEDQFSPACLDAMASSSGAFGGEIAMTTWHCEFNWKLIYENLRDPNHVKFLHARSFGDYVDFQVPVHEPSWQASMRPLVDMSVSAMRREMRSFSGGGAVAAIPDRRRVPWHDKVDRWGGENDVYYDWLIYPNLHLSSGNSGHSFSIEHHAPVAPGRTDLELIWVMSRKKQPFDDSHQALIANMYGSKQIVGEDVAMLEAIQRGLHGEAPIPTHGAYEFVNQRIERWYKNLMESDYGI